MIVTGICNIAQPLSVTISAIEIQVKKYFLDGINMRFLSIHFLEIASLIRAFEQDPGQARINIFSLLWIKRHNGKRSLDGHEPQHPSVFFATVRSSLRECTSALGPRRSLLNTACAHSEWSAPQASCHPQYIFLAHRKIPSFSAQWPFIANHEPSFLQCLFSRK